MSKAFENEMVKNMEMLNSEQQEKVMTYIKSLLNHEGAKQNLIAFAGALDEKSVREMNEAINLGCETIDKNEW